MTSKSNAARLHSARARFCVLTLLCACGSGGGGGPGPTKVTDQDGRHCSVPFDSIDVPACDAAPKPSGACMVGEKACFQLGTVDVAAKYKPAAICSACCGDGNSTILPDDCSGIVCKTDDDCPADYPSCSGGQCFTGAVSAAGA